MLFDNPDCGASCPHLLRGPKPGGVWASSQGPARKGVSSVFLNNLPGTREIDLVEKRGVWAKGLEKPLQNKKMGKGPAQRHVAAQRPLKHGFNGPVRCLMDWRNDMWPLR